MRRKPVDQTGAKTKNHYIAFVALFLLQVLLLAMSAFRHSHFSLSQAYNESCVRVSVYTHTYMQNIS